jgi:uncharacterized protein (UPF0335 family)
MKLEDLPPDASPELRALFRLSERQAAYATFFLNEIVELRTTLRVLINLQMNLLAQNGFDTEALKDQVQKDEKQGREENLALLQERFAALLAQSPPEKTGK